MDAAFVSHIGCVRQVNEDYGMILRQNEQWLLAMIADGMGGHQAGDVASRMTADAVRRVFSQADGDLTIERGKELVQQAVMKANEEVFRYAEQHPECKGMGTTIALVLLTSSWGIVAHIGDSRVYLLEDDLRLLTEDHSLVYELVKNGQISQEEAFHHPQKHVLMRALGTEQHVQIDISTFRWKKGNRLLLCSDGLSNKVSEEAMLPLLKEDDSARNRCEKLIQKALDAGGEDNISVIVIDDSK
ncbi:Stp1/IreP family PP2C-type Ser/Thr phosphatase [Bacillaceae bacterium]